MTVNTASMDAVFKDLYPRPGERIKQWVVDLRKEEEWIRATCPKVDIADHDDNTGAWCSNSGRSSWYDMLHHNCCTTCNDMAWSTKMRVDITAWRVELSARPPCCTDRSVLSDEVAEDMSLAENPLYKLVLK